MGNKCHTPSENEQDNKKYLDIRIQLFKKVIDEAKYRHTFFYCREQLAQAIILTGEDFDKAASIYIELGDELTDGEEQIRRHMYYLTGILCSIASGDIGSAERYQMHCFKNMPPFKNSWQRNFIHSIIILIKIKNQWTYDGFISDYKLFLSQFDKYQLICINKILEAIDNNKNVAM